MTLSEFKTVLSSTNLPVAYGFFPERPNAPYIEYEVITSNNFYADNVAYKRANDIEIYLFTDKKDETTETLLEQKLDGVLLNYSKSEMYLDEAKLYQITYEVKLNG